MLFFTIHEASKIKTKNIQRGILSFLFITLEISGPENDHVLHEVESVSVGLQKVLGAVRLFHFQVAVLVYAGYFHVLVPMIDRHFLIPSK